MGGSRDEEFAYFRLKKETKIGLWVLELKIR